MTHPQQDDAHEFESVKVSTGKCEYCQDKLWGPRALVCRGKYLFYAPRDGGGGNTREMRDCEKEMKEKRGAKRQTPTHNVLLIYIIHIHLFSWYVIYVMHIPFSMSIPMPSILPTIHYREILQLQTTQTIFFLIR